MNDEPYTSLEIGCLVITGLSFGYLAARALLFVAVQHGWLPVPSVL